MPVIRLEITGRVQGVGYRWFARESARRLGLAGWVRNRADGAVEVAAEGEQTDLDAFVDELRRGPPSSHVTLVRVLDAAALSNLSQPFSVDRSAR